MSIAPLLPVAPTSPTLPVGLTYGKDGNIRINEKVVFNYPSTLSSGNIDSPKFVPFNCYLNDLIFSAYNTSNAILTISLHKVTNNVDSILDTFNIPANNTFSTRIYKSNYVLNQNDILYCNLDSVGTGGSNLTVQGTFNSRG